MLPGYVPQRGKYNETYLSVMQGIVQRAAKYGIYILLDMHQDVLSRKFCVEGFPDWAVNSGDMKHLLCRLSAILLQICCPRFFGKRDCR